jgi:tetratricopeptide (TPR) repeat protein
LNRAIQLNPNNFLFYVTRGAVKQREDKNGALADYNRAIQLNPNYAKTYMLRSNLKFLDFKDLAGAIDDMNRAAKLSQQQGNTKDYELAIYILKGMQNMKKMQQGGRN